MYTSTKYSYFCLQSGRDSKAGKSTPGGKKASAKEKTPPSSGHQSPVSNIDPVLDAKYKNKLYTQVVIYVFSLCLCFVYSLLLYYVLNQTIKSVTLTSDIKFKNLSLTGDKRIQIGISEIGLYLRNCCSLFDFVSASVQFQ